MILSSAEAIMRTHEVSISKKQNITMLESNLIDSLPIINL